MTCSLRRIAVVGMLLSVLAGCGTAATSVQPNLQPARRGLPGSMVARLGNRQVARAPSASELAAAAKSSWMAPDAKRRDLLYVSDSVNNVVDVYTYPEGKLAGTLGGFSLPEGACTDARGNVWIASQDQNEILEYAHGGTAPIATLTQEDQLIDGCSVDTATGTLAVDSFCQISGIQCVQPGSVFVYADIKKPPTQYIDPHIFNLYFCGYDPSGNLFVDGNENASGNFQLAELPHGSSTFTSITLNRRVYFPGGVQWDGKYLAVGDQEAGDQLTSSVHQIAISGSTGTVVGTTKLKGTFDVVQFWIQGSRIVAPDIRRGPGDARIFKYPSGGVPVHVITGLSEPLGATVSLAQNRADRGRATP